MRKKLLINLTLMTIVWIELYKKSNCNTDPEKNLKASYAECGGRFLHVKCPDGRIISVKDVLYALSGNSSHDCQRTVFCVHQHSLDDCYKYASLVIYSRAKELCNNTQQCGRMFANPNATDIVTNCSKSTKTCVTFQLLYTCVQDNLGRSPRSAFVGLIVGASVLAACFVCSVFVFLLIQRKRKMSLKAEDSPQMSNISESKWDKTNSVYYSEIATTSSSYEETLYSQVKVLERSATADQSSSSSSRPANHSDLNEFIGQRPEETLRQYANSKVDTPAEFTYAEIADPYFGERVLQKHLKERSSEVKLDDEVTVIENFDFYY